MARLAKPRSAKRDPNGWREVPHGVAQSSSSAAIRWIPLRYSLPQNRRGPLVVRDHGQNQRAVIALCELRPVQCDHGSVRLPATNSSQYGAKSIDD